MKVCVIVDDFIITGMISKLLKANGHECVVENDGRAGLSALKKEVFDVVILEVAMPDLSGLDIVKALNKSGRIKDQKICIYSASSSEDTKSEELKDLGVKEFLKKPMDLENLLEKLEKIANNIESDPSPKEPTGSKFKNEIPRPAGVILLGIFYLVFGIFLIPFAIILGSTLVPFMKNAMSIVPGIGNIDSMMMLSLDMISVLPGIDDLPSKIENYGSTDLSAAKNMEVILDIIMGTLGSVGILFIVGIAALVVGRGLLKGKNWVRNVTIVFAIISMVVTVSYMGKVNDMFLLGSFVFDTIVFFYMLRPHVRKYFTQTSIKNSKIKT